MGHIEGTTFGLVTDTFEVTPPSCSQPATAPEEKEQAAAAEDAPWDALQADTPEEVEGSARSDKADAPAPAVTAESVVLHM